MNKQDRTIEVDPLHECYSTVATAQPCTQNTLVGHDNWDSEREDEEAKIRNYEF